MPSRKHQEKNKILSSQDFEPSIETRPDLEEFLSALDGFVTQPAVLSQAPDSRFLGTFCRSIGSSEGHLIQRNQEGRLESLVTFGLDKKFNKHFNETNSDDINTLTPMGRALSKKEVIAIIDVDKEKNLPPGFIKLMKANGFASMVAVPLLGKEDPSKVLCAYYHDVCLFDQGTMDHLFMIGKMAGAAMERDAKFAYQPVLPDAPKELNLDHWVESLAVSSKNHLEIFSEAAVLAKTLIHAVGAVCGPVRKTPEGFFLTMAGVAGAAQGYLSHRFHLPKIVEKYVLESKSHPNLSPIKITTWEKMEKLVGGGDNTGWAAPIIWKGKLIGLLIVWNKVQEAELAKKNVRQLAALVALALNLKEN